MEPTDIIDYPLATEKSIRLMESENKLIFAVAKKATRGEIKVAVEQLFKAKVVKVNTFVTVKGKKRAYLKFSDESPAIDVATQLGLM